METINFKDIDFSKFIPLDVNSSESNIYLDEENAKIYKIFKEELNAYVIELKSAKLNILNDKKVHKSIVVPDSKIIDTSLVGTREDNIEGVDLSDIRYKYQDVFTILNILLKVSKTTEEIHNEGIIISDYTTGNIRYGNDGEVYFFDVLSYIINKIPQSSISDIFCKYINNYKVKSNIKTDKITFMLHLVNMIFSKSVFSITDYEFDEMREKVKFLNDIKPIFNTLKVKRKSIPDVPYLHEVVSSNNEEYIFQKIR